MKKVFLFLLAATTLVSCGSDDGDGGGKRPSQITIQGGNESYLYTMSYDNKGKLATMTSNWNGSNTYVFSYNDKNKVSTVAASGSTNEAIVFGYTADGKLSSVTHGSDTPIAIQQTSETSYVVDGITITLDSKGDIASYDSATFTRDTGKGAFANVKGVDGLTMVLVDQLSLYFASKRPLKTLAGGGTSTVFNNTWSGGNFSGATFSAANTTYTMNVTY